MSEITLVRHAQASFGTDDYDRLSALGHQQSRWLGAHFAELDQDFDLVLRGSLRRHRETAAGIAAHHALPDVIEDAQLDELHYDNLENAYHRATGAQTAQTRPEFLQHFPAMFQAWDTGTLDEITETYETFETRVLAALAKTNGAKRALVVTSGGVIGVIMRSVLGLSATATADLLLNIHNASIHRLVLEEGRLRLALFNAVPHLEHRDRAHARTYV